MTIKAAQVVISLMLLEKHVKAQLDCLTLLSVLESSELYMVFLHRMKRTS